MENIVSIIKGELPLIHIYDVFIPKIKIIGSKFKMILGKFKMILSKFKMILRSRIPKL
jgi:hypothetical protein